MNIRRLRQLVVPAVLCAELALVPLAAAGGSGAGVEGPQQVAKALVDELVDGLREHSELTDGFVALQPLDPRQLRGRGPNKWRLHRDRRVAIPEEQKRVSDAEVSKPEPGHRFRDCMGCPELVVVAPGEYRMGSPSGEAGPGDSDGSVHRVSIGEAIAVGVYEVTVGQWRRFVGETGYATRDGCWTYEEGVWEERSGRNWERSGFVQDEGHPVVCVSWEDAQAYVGWLSAETGEEYRLPSESEWEYVARAGTRSARYWGEDAGEQCRYANGSDESVRRRYSDWRWRVVSCDDGYVHTSPVGSFEANGYGLHDVLGNVSEWVEDCWNESYVGAPADGSAWTRGNCEGRMLRGGSWDDFPWNLRFANRGTSTPDYRIIFFGFRIVRTLRSPASRPRVGVQGAAPPWSVFGGLVCIDCRG